MKWIKSQHGEYVPSFRSMDGCFEIHYFGGGWNLFKEKVYVKHYNCIATAKKAANKIWKNPEKDWY